MYQTPLNRSRSDKFQLILDLPLALKKLYNTETGDNYKVDPIQFSVYGSPVPSINVPAIDVPFGGQVYKTSSFSRPAYDTLQIKFLVDNGYKNYWTLWNWLNILNDYKSSTSNAVSLNDNQSGTFGNPMNEYTSKFTIFGLDEFNKKIISFEYTNAIPTSLSEISYSSQEPNEINSTISFVFGKLNVNLISDVDQVNC
jgi:hypothetical protein